MKDVDKYYSADQLSEHWHQIHHVTTVGRDGDFPWFSAWVLWERLAPKHILPLEQINDFI